VRDVAFDTETHLIAPGQLFPQLVCVSVYDEAVGQAELLDWRTGPDRILSYLSDPEVRVITLNGAFDLGIILAERPTLEATRTVFQALAQDRVLDVGVHAMLIDIATGKFQQIEGGKRNKAYSLAALAHKWCGIFLQKEDTWRLRYAELQDVPLDQWPQDARDYAEKDAETTYRVHAALVTWVRSEGDAGGVMPDTYRQVRAAWVLHLMAGWGVRIDGSMVATIRANLEEMRRVSYDLCDRWGLFKKKKDGSYVLTKKGQRSKNLKKLQEYIAEGYRKLGEEPPTTPGRIHKSTGERIPAISTGADEARESGHPAAIAYADCAGADKLLSTYIPALERGAQGYPVTSSPNVLVASGRTSWQNPNWQNPPKVGGIRECVIPRPGMVFVGADLDTVELRALAQRCLELFQYSEMAVALQSGRDLHTALAADLLGTTYEDVVARLAAGDPEAEAARQLAKQINFGLPGGMGAVKFALTCANNGQPLDPDEHEAIKLAYKYKDLWFKRWPEMRDFMARAGEVTGEDGEGTIQQAWSGRIRGGMFFCAAANTEFQGRVADGAKLALWRLALACYTEPESPLFGCRLVLFLHDEFILEVPEDRVDAAAKELVRIVCGAVQEVIPDIPITSQAAAFRRWLKGAKPVRIDEKLVPGRPEKSAETGKVKWVPDV